MADMRHCAHVWAWLNGRNWCPKCGADGGPVDVREASSWDPRHRMPRESCPGHERHWFTVYGAPGLRSPRCQRCGADNPQPLTPDELLDYEDHMQASDRYHRENRNG